MSWIKDFLIAADVTVKAFVYGEEFKSHFQARLQMTAHYSSDMQKDIAQLSTPRGKEEHDTEMGFN